MMKEITPESPGIESRSATRGSFVDIHKPEGTYRVIYEVHGLALNPKQLPDPLHGLFLETGAGSYIQKPLSTFQELKEEQVEYTSLFSTLEARRIPLYLYDQPFNNPWLTYDADSAVLLGELALGAHMLARRPFDEKTGRRRFLKIASLSVGAWLQSPALSMLQRYLTTMAEFGEQQGILFEKISQKLHPEANFFLLTLRNVLAAYKKQWLMTNMGNRPSFATILGLAHTGVEEQIQSTLQTKFRFLQASRPVWESAVERESFYKLVRYIFDNERWRVERVVEIPELKALLD